MNDGPSSLQGRLALCKLFGVISACDFEIGSNAKGRCCPPGDVRVPPDAFRLCPVVRDGLSDGTAPFVSLKDTLLPYGALGDGGPALLDL